MNFTIVSSSLVKRQVMEVALGTLLLMLCAQIIIPIRPVFVSLYTVAIIFIGLTYTRVTGPLAVISYIMLGIAGFPVFGGFSGGVAALMGTTGGYIAGSLVTVCIMPYLREKFFISHSVLNRLVLCLIGNVVIMSFGFIWLSKFLGVSGAFYGGVVPFIVPGIIKSFILVALIRVVRPRS